MGLKVAAHHMSFPVSDLTRAMAWDMPEAAATPLAGLVIHTAPPIPQPGQIFSFDGYRFEVMHSYRNKITSLKITREKKKAAR